jgi:hypothetical protein
LPRWPARAILAACQSTDSSVVERLVYTELVGGSNPSPCTSWIKDRRFLTAASTEGAWKAPILGGGARAEPKERRFPTAASTECAWKAPILGVLERSPRIGGFQPLPKLRALGKRLSLGVLERSSRNGGFQPPPKLRALGKRPSLGAARAEPKERRFSTAAIAEGAWKAPILGWVLVRSSRNGGFQPLPKLRALGKRPSLGGC